MDMQKTYDPKNFEDRIYEYWEKSGFFRAEIDENKVPFTIMMPPPNITGQLHMGHAMDAGSTSFRGLPIPSAAIFLIGVAGWVNSYGYPGSAVIVLLCLLASFAMVGRFYMFSLKFKNFAVHENLRRYVLLAAAVVFMIIYGLSGLAWTILLYVLLSVMSRRRI